MCIYVTIFTDAYTNTNKYTSVRAKRVRVRVRECVYICAISNHILYINLGQWLFLKYSAGSKSVGKVMEHNIPDFGTQNISDFGTQNISDFHSCATYESSQRQLLAPYQNINQHERTQPPPPHERTQNLRRQLEFTSFFCFLYKNLLICLFTTNPQPIHHKSYAHSPPFPKQPTLNPPPTKSTHISLCITFNP